MYSGKLLVFRVYIKGYVHFYILTELFSTLASINVTEQGDAKNEQPDLISHHYIMTFSTGI